MFSRGQADTMELLGSRLAWVAVTMALIGTMVRWYESYLIGADIGHIPVSNLYEVFVMFCWMTAAVLPVLTKSSTGPRAGRLRDAGGERGGGLSALVHGGARSA
jgi:ABC-type transport system involved in cytochrome c biogenesis permease subunit